MPGMPLPFDAHLPLLVQLPMLPSPCQLWEDKQWGWGGWLGQLGSHPCLSLARLCPGHKEQSESCSAPAAERLEGGKRETHTERVATMGLSTLTALPSEALTQRHTERGKLGPTLI